MSGANADEKTTEQRIQDEIAGDDALVRPLFFLFSLAELYNTRPERALLEGCLQAGLDV